MLGGVLPTEEGIGKEIDVNSETIDDPRGREPSDS